jgi:hypothetical protein
MSGGLIGSIFRANFVIHSKNNGFRKFGEIPGFFFRMRGYARTGCISVLRQGPPRPTQQKLARSGRRR